MQRKWSTLSRLGLFLVLVAGTVLGLQLLNWLPLALQGGGLRRYNSVEDVQRSLGLKQLYLPSYFPETMQWPPSEILGQLRPYRLVLIHFQERGSGRVILAICQAKQEVEEVPPLRLEPSRIRGEQSLELKGHKAVLELGVDAAGNSCNRLSWVENGFRLTVVARESRDELLRIAESMASD